MHTADKLHLAYGQPRTLSLWLRMHSADVAKIKSLEISFPFKVRNNMLHHTIQINHQLDATISPVFLP
jgi:hypothetical protein